jgi:hypothetical protein
MLSYFVGVVLGALNLKAVVTHCVLKESDLLLCSRWQITAAYLLS